MEYYLTNKIFRTDSKCPKVTSVKLKSDGSILERGYTDTAEVRLEGTEE